MRRRLIIVLIAFVFGCSFLLGFLPLPSVPLSVLCFLQILLGKTGIVQFVELCAPRWKGQFREMLSNVPFPVLASEHTCDLDPRILFLDTKPLSPSAYEAAARYFESCWLTVHQVHFLSHTCSSQYPIAFQLTKQKANLERMTLLNPLPSTQAPHAVYVLSWAGSNIVVH